VRLCLYGILAERAPAPHQIDQAIAALDQARAKLVLAKSAQSS